MLRAIVICVKKNLMIAVYKLPVSTFVLGQKKNMSFNLGTRKHLGLRWTVGLVFGKPLLVVPGEKL